MRIEANSSTLAIVAVATYAVVSAMMGNTVGEAQEPITSDWSIRETPSTSSTKGTIATLLARKSDDPSVVVTPMLSIMCQGGRAAVEFTSGQPIDNENSAITYRVGPSDEQAPRWEKGSNPYSASLSDWRFSRPFLEQLKDNNTLIISSVKPKTITIFDLGRVESVVARINNECERL